MGIYASFLIIYFINTNYTNSVKSIYFLLLYVTKSVHEYQIELGVSKIRGSAELNINFSENLFYVYKMMRSSLCYKCKKNLLRIEY